MSTRRDFLNSGAALAAPAFLSAQSPNDAVRVAVIGVGNRGAYLLRHILNVPKVQIVALCDLDAERLAAAAKAAAAKGHKPATYADFRKMLDERKDIDAVFICTPEHWHFQMAMDALKADKDIYLEKP
ncbi:MAG: Gfo/Idh/MocA family oxidoreductase, partial [Bryobacterales bacterium]|nr:Gfo/Idh/MocA family oxidoreductase [Bryobacterales bacterium]